MKRKTLDESLIDEVEQDIINQGLDVKRIKNVNI